MKDYKESGEVVCPYPFVSIDEALAWLGKQKDNDELIKEFGEYKVKYTQEVLEKHINSMSNKDDERLRETTISFLKDFAEQGYENAVECIDWLENQKSTEWSEEDERICQCIIQDQEEALDDVRNDKYGHSEIISDLKETYRERINWLNSLKEKIQNNI